MYQPSIAGDHYLFIIDGLIPVFINVLIIKRGKILDRHLH